MKDRLDAGGGRRRWFRHTAQLQRSTQGQIPTNNVRNRLLFTIQSWRASIAQTCIYAKLPIIYVWT